MWISLPPLKFVLKKSLLLNYFTTLVTDLPFLKNKLYLSDILYLILM